MKLWMLSLPFRMITEVSDTYRVEPELVMAFVSVESSGQTCATRYEPHYRYLFDQLSFSRRNRISLDTEIIHQKTSWGLMQVMGGVARERGFTGPLVKLCEPKIGLQYGIAHLVNFIDRYGDLDEAISSYNQGGPYRKADNSFKNQVYVDKILGRYNYLKSIK